MTPKQKYLLDDAGLKDQVKEAAETQKDGGTGTIAFTDSDAVDDAADNTALQPSHFPAIVLFLLMESLSWALLQQSTQMKTIRNLLTPWLVRMRPFLILMQVWRAFVKASPNFDDKPYYEITIITQDDGGKKFSETFIIDVVPEFDSLAEPDATVASDFETILGQNTLFKDMKDFVELQTTPDGQLVLVEIGDFADGDHSSASDGEDGPVIAFVSITERGYELRNPATNEYMGGFFTYETDDLTYTGYEVFVDDMTILTEYEDDLIKYFSQIVNMA